MGSFWDLLIEVNNNDLCVSIVILCSIFLFNQNYIFSFFMIRNTWFHL